jgi:hypothetical protein
MEIVPNSHPTPWNPSLSNVLSSNDCEILATSLYEVEKMKA